MTIPAACRYCKTLIKWGQGSRADDAARDQGFCCEQCEGIYLAEKELTLKREGL